MGIDSDLSLALMALLCARDASIEAERAHQARTAIAIASAWPDSRVSKAIRSHAYSYFLYESAAAVQAMGGIEKVQQLAQSPSLDLHYTKGLGGLCSRRYDEAAESLIAAGELAGDDPFIDLTLLIVRIEQGVPLTDPSVLRCMTTHSGHPLLELLGLNSHQGE